MVVFGPWRTTYLESLVASEMSRTACFPPKRVCSAVVVSAALAVAPAEVAAAAAGDVDHGSAGYLVVEWRKGRSR